MDAHQKGGITIDLTVTASQCRTLEKGGSITLKDETLKFMKGVKAAVVKQKDLITMEQISPKNTKMNATHLDGQIARLLKAM